MRLVELGVECLFTDLSITVAGFDLTQNQQLAFPTVIAQLLTIYGNKEDKDPCEGTPPYSTT